jgi:endonuclease/exonuclease/phosphatase family metal-dependent hydrolase
MRIIAYLLISCAVIGLIGTVIWALTRPTIETILVPSNAKPGAPNRALRFVSYNILHNQRGADAVAAQIVRLNPDFVFLQEIESRDVNALAEKLKIPLDATHVLYYPSVNLAGDASWGNAILAKFPMYDASSIPNPGGGSFGLWAWALVDEKKFRVACVHLSATYKANPQHLIESGQNRFKELSHLHDAWTLGGAAPIIIGGDFNQLPIGNDYAIMTADWSDALKALGKTEATFHDGLLQTRIDYFLLSKHFNASDGAVESSNASDHSPIWMEASANAAK